MLLEQAGMVECRASTILLIYVQNAKMKDIPSQEGTSKCFDTGGVSSGEWDSRRGRGWGCSRYAGIQEIQNCGVESVFWW